MGLRWLLPKYIALYKDQQIAASAAIAYGGWKLCYFGWDLGKSLFVGFVWKKKLIPPKCSCGFQVPLTNLDPPLMDSVDSTYYCWQCPGCLSSFEASDSPEAKDPKRG